MIGFSVARERSDEGRDVVVVAMRDETTGEHVTVTLFRRGASCLAACLFAATPPDGDDFETDFRVNGAMNR